MSYEIDISDRCSVAKIDLLQLHSAVRTGLETEQVQSAVLSVTLVDNTTIHDLNRRHLQHDGPTDVISFPLHWQHPGRSVPGTRATGRARGARIEGEIVASTEFACFQAKELGWPVQSELTLYVIHGMLHLCGYDDMVLAEQQIMQARELAVFRALGQDTIPRRIRPKRSSRHSEDDSSSLPAPTDCSEESAG